MNVELGYSSGKTSCMEIKALSNLYDGARIMIKDESKNPFGTYKDRRSANIVNTALLHRTENLALITAGNAGYSLMKYCEGTGIHCYHILDSCTSNTIKEKLSTPDSSVIEVDLSQEILTTSLQFKRIIGMDQQSNLWDVTNGFHHTYISLFEEIEMYHPDIVIVPFGSGEAFWGMYQAICAKNLTTKIIGVGVKQQHASAAGKLCAAWTPYLVQLQQALDKGHSVILLDEEEVNLSFEFAKSFMECEPSSGVVFAALERIKPKINETVILINSGKGLL